MQRVTAGRCDKLHATAVRPAYAAHYVQIGDKRTAMVRLGYTRGGGLTLESFSSEVPYTIFLSGTIWLTHPCVSVSDTPQDVPLSELLRSLHEYEGWQIHLP